MEMEGLEATNRLIALPFFIITFSLTALIAISVYHFRLTEGQHNVVLAATVCAALSMLIGLFPMLHRKPKALVLYSITCAFILGLIAPLSW
jgi:hypothetical protein